MIRWCLAAMLLLASATGAPAADTPPGGLPKAPALPLTADQITTDVMRQSIGAPMKADLGPEATVRLHESLLIVPHDPAVRLLTLQRRPFPADLVALLAGPPGVETPGAIRFIASGFVDSNKILAWTPDDILDSLEDTLKRENQERIKQHLEPLEVRRWIRPPRYDPDHHLLSWAALILPASAPKESDGQIVFHGLAFGRDGYIELTAAASVEGADPVGAMVDSFLLGVAFKPGKTYQDYQKGDPVAPGGVAAVMGIDKLHKAVDRSSLWSSDLLVPIIGGFVTLIGAIALYFYIQRYMRRLARRT